LIDGPGHACLAGVYGAFGNRGGRKFQATCKANARLVVAAPDLFAACKAAMNVFRDFDLGHLAAFDLLDDVIKRVEGHGP